MIINPAAAGPGPLLVRHLPRDGLPDYASVLSLTVLGAGSVTDIWTAGVIVDSQPRRSLPITAVAIAIAMLPLPLGSGTISAAMVSMTEWVSLGVIGIYNQNSIRPG